MTHVPHLLPSLARAAAIAAGGTAIAYLLVGLLRPRTRFAKRWFWTLLLVPFITPVLPVGYLYATWSVGFSAAKREVLYGALMLLRLAPVAVVVLHFAPTYVSPESIHSWRLVRGHSRRVLSPVLLSRLIAPAAAWGVIFLLAFAEFDLAAFMPMKTWTVSLFDQHVVSGLRLRDSLAMAMVPALCEAGVFVALLTLLFRKRSAETTLPRRRMALPARVAAWVFLLLAVAAVCILPVGYLLVDAARGIDGFNGWSFLWKEIGASLLFASASACVAYFAAGGLAETAGKRRWRLLAGGLLSLPGLLGPLVLSLCVMALFMLAPMRPMYNSPAPLLVALVALLWPLAFILRAVLLAPEGESRHAAGLLELSTHRPVARRGVRLGRALRSRGAVWVGFLLFCWAYFDLGASAILAPPGMTPATVRLHNLMHYGHTATLSVMMSLTVAVAVLMLLILLLAQRATRVVTDV